MKNEQHLRFSEEETKHFEGLLEDGELAVAIILLINAMRENDIWANLSEDGIVRVSEVGTLLTRTISNESCFGLWVDAVAKLMMLHPTGMLTRSIEQGVEANILTMRLVIYRATMKPIW